MAVSVVRAAANATPLPSAPVMHPLPQNEMDAIEPSAPQAPSAPEASASHTYVNAADLTTKPRAMTEVFLSFPPNAPGGLYKLTLVIHIDEHGLVDHINVSDTDLPHVFADTAINAFSQIQFTPGQVDGNPVKTSLTIEVTFDSEVPLASPDDDSSRTPDDALLEASP